ncbi:MAG: DUF3857 domain-containing protein [bacterium]|nr:DUF3857 domain-containing protein [bacterium]
MLRWLMVCLVGLAGVTQAADFPPITDEERSLAAVPGQATAPALVLYRKAELRMLDYPREVSSYLKVNVRIKILTEEGKKHGEVEIPHSGFYRLKKVEGRTVLPNGQIVPLPEDAVFEERRSRSLKAFVTKLVFPAVEVGAILDYRYTVRWDSLFYLEPWYFHGRLPTRLSEITYIKPNNLGLEPWAVQTQPQPLQTSTTKTKLGTELRIWAEQLAGIPDEPYSFPFADLATRFMLVPTVVNLSSGPEPLLDSWRSACSIFADDYKNARRSDRQTKKKASALTAGLPSLIEKVASLHAFVRDEIRTDLTYGVGIGDKQTVDRVLADGHGTPVAKALLLQSLLAGVGVDSDLIWVADRNLGRVDLSVANPWWFDGGLVRIEVDRETTYLDPVDRSAGFGQLPPYYEGTPALVFHRSKPEIIELPIAPATENLRRASLDLAVDSDGRVGGRGSLELEGHQAWRYVRLGEDTAATEDAWREYLEERFSGYDVTAIEVEEDLREQHVRIGWSLRQRDEEVLGDEVSVYLSKPLGPAAHPFSLPAGQRRTPVQMLYGRLDRLTATLSWPEGWELQAAPPDASHTGTAGTVEVHTETAETARRVEFKRRFELSGREFGGNDGYTALRNLYDQASKLDARPVVLLRE